MIPSPGTCKLCGVAAREVFSVPAKLGPADPAPHGELCKACLRAAALVLRALQERA